MKPSPHQPPPVGELIDLHLHSRHSDGTMGPAELVRAARAAGLSVISLTDHDTIHGLDEALLAGRSENIIVIPGVELSVGYKGDEIHILGYGIDWRSRSFRHTLSLLAGERETRMEKMVARLRSAGIGADIDEVRKLAGGRILSRLHLAVYLLRKGFVSSRDEAFSRYIGNGRPAYVSRRLLSLKDAVTLVRESGGIPVMAHPGSTGRDDLIDYLIRIGLQGLEAHYPQHSPGTTAKYVKLCNKYNLYATGGSDFHGEAKPEIKLGKGYMPRGEFLRMHSYIKYD